MIIEVLVAVVIISFIGTVLYSTMSQGMKIWHRAMKDYPEHDIDFFIEKMTRDLSNSLNYPKDALIGGASSMQFYSLTFVPNAKGEIGNAGAQMPVRVRYSLERDKNQLTRQQERFEEMLYPTYYQRVPPSVVAEKVREASFEYYVYDEKTRSYSWKKQWRNACLPLAVKLKLDYGDVSAVKKAVRIVNLPAAKSCSIAP